MGKKLFCITLCLFFVFPLTGCWNYRGLHEIAIVSGLAIDRNPQNGNYKLTFEIVDLKKPIKEKGPTAIIIESEGKTLFDAARLAKTRIDGKLYYGNMQIVIISSEIVQTEGISGIIDWFLRDSECRETINFIVSQENTAGIILAFEGTDQGIVANELHQIIITDQKITSSTADIELYQIFNTLHAEGLSVTMPAFHNVLNNGEIIPEANGIAAFKEDKLCGFLTREESKYFLFATNEVEGGILALSSVGGEKNDMSLEISENKTKQSFSYQNGKIKIKIKTNTSVFLDELHGKLDALDKEKITAIEKTSQDFLNKNIENVINKAQTEFESDIFGFGNMIYKQDPKLWLQLSDNWDTLFPMLEVEVDSRVKIVNSAAIKKS